MLNPVPVLLYHSVSDDPPEWIRRFAVSPDVFRRHVEMIASSGAVPLRVSEYSAALRGARALPERAVVITFDDGLADFRQQALPALEEAALPATLFVTSGFIDEEALPPGAFRPTGPWLDPPAVLDLHERGVEIGAHSHTHPHLDTLSAAVARAEVALPKQILEELLGTQVESFAFPHGFRSSSLRRLVRECGYTSACAVRNAFSGQSDDVFALARLTIRADTSVRELASWLEGEGADTPPHRENPRTRAFRIYRRGRAILHRKPGFDWA